MNANQYETRLRQGIQQMGLSLTDRQVTQLLNYHKQLIKWNKAYNLTAIKDGFEMVDRHLLDSLSLLAFLEQRQQSAPPKRLIDVGTGAGLPGIILAVLYPELAITLLDSNGKKTRFLFQTCLQLGLKNVCVENNRIEKYSPAEKFDIVTSRAFASLSDMVRGARHLLAENGQYWAMKGVYPEGELADCEALLTNIQVHPLNVAYCEGERHLVIAENRE